MDLTPFAVGCPFSLAAAVLCLLLIALPWGLRLLSPGGRRRPPVAGTVVHMLKNFHRLYDYQTDLSRRYKTFRMLSLFRSYVYTVDPANVEHILKTNFDNYGKGPYLSETLNVLLGEGIFAVDGEKWRHQRKVASYEFSTKVLRDYSSVVFRKNAAKLAHIISDAATSERTFDIQDMLAKFTMDSIFEVGFGEDLDTLSGLRKDAHAFTKAFDDANRFTMLRFVDLSWKVKRLLNIGSEAALKKAVEVIDDFVYEVIQRKREQQEAKQQSDLDAKFCLSDDVLPDGFRVKRGDMVDYQPYPMGRMKGLWGEDAEAFLPERWLDEHGIFQPQSPFKFTAFQSGPRICLGKEFAYRQMKILAAILFHRFKFKVSDEQHAVNYITMITPKIEGGLRLRALYR